MAHHPDPLEILSFEIAAEQRRYLRIANADGTVDEFEHAHYSALGSFAGKLQSLSALRKLAHHLENGQPLTTYSHRLASHAGLGLIDLDAERRAREGNITPFPTIQEIG